MEIKLGDKVESLEIDKMRTLFKDFKFVVPSQGPWRKEFGEYIFNSEDKGKTWFCVKNEEGSLLKEVNITGHVTPDKRKSRDYYTRYHTTSGGRPAFNPVSGTGGRNNKKTLD